MDANEFEEKDVVNYKYAYDNGVVDSNYSALSNITDQGENYVNGCDGWWGSAGVDLNNP